MLPVSIFVYRVPQGAPDPILIFLLQAVLSVQAGRHVQGLPEDLARAMLAQAGHGVNLDEEIGGEVAL